MASESGQEKRETLADIVAEFRAMPSDIIIDAKADFVFSRYADRIEAALKREREAVLADAERLGRGRFEVVYASERCDREAVTGRNQFGNSAAMRDALVQCELFLSNVSRHGHPTLNPGDKCTACDGVDELRGMVVRALSAPARNCDAMSRSICTKHFSTTYEGNRDGLCDVQTEREKNIHLYYMELIDWLFAPAAAEEGAGE